MLVNKQMKNFWLILVFVLLWNSGFIGAEWGLAFAGPFSLLFWRYLLLSILLLIYLSLKGTIIRPGWRYAGQQMLIGLLSHGVWLSCVLLAIDYGVPAGIVALVVAFQPLATGALSGAMAGEPTSWKQWLGLLIGFTGVLVPILPRVNFQDPHQIFAWFIPLGSVIAITLASLYQRKINLQKKHRNHPLPLSLFYQSLATTLAVAIPAVFLENLSVEWNPVFISSLIWLVLGVSLGAYALMWILIDRLDATKVASLFYLGPPVTMLMAWIAFGDTIEFIDLAGMALVIFGVGLTYLREG
jgi:drug/metabolite transporter (DMT)-like permease